MNSNHFLIQDLISLIFITLIQKYEIWRKKVMTCILILLVTSYVQINRIKDNLIYVDTSINWVLLLSLSCKSCLVSWCFIVRIFFKHPVKWKCFYFLLPYLLLYLGFLENIKPMRSKRLQILYVICKTRRFYFLNVILIAMLDSHIF